MVDIPHGQIGVIVQTLVVVVLKQEVANATIHHLQVLVRKIAQLWGQVWNQKGAI